MKCPEGRQLSREGVPNLNIILIWSAKAVEIRKDIFIHLIHTYSFANNPEYSKVHFDILFGSKIVNKIAFHCSERLLKM